MKRVYTAVAACAAIASCKVGVQTDVYTADIMAVLDGAEGLTTPMVISFEVSGANGCEKAKDGLMSPLTAAYGEAEFIGCEKQRFETYAQFRVAADLVHELINETSESDQPIYVGARPLEDHGLIHVAYWLNPEALEEFQGRIPEKLTRFQTSDPELQLSATLSNDLRESLELQVNDAFADGRAIQGTQTFSLGRRNEVRISLSNVTNTAMTQGDISALIAYIPLPKPTKSTE